MPVLAALSAIWLLQTPAADPNRLSIGGRGTVTVAPGQIVSTRTGRPATVAEIAQSARGKGWVFLGEQHATEPHQQLHADVVRALVAEGRRPVIGLEMITRPKQDVLDAWTAGKLDEEAFLKDVDWKGQWGFDFRFYRPIFAVAKEKSLPVVGLNVPRDWVRAVGRGGYAALPTTARLQLPAKMDTTVKDHRAVFNSLMGGHPMSGTQGENMYAAQVLWDEGMADTALKYRERFNPDVFVVMAGSGHIMYRQGINRRIAMRRAGDGVTVVMLSSKEPVEVSRGIGDFVFVSPG